MKKIAVIEDTITVQEEIKMILDFEGFSVHSASSGKEGLELIEKINPDLILCDIMMPDMDGHDLLRNLKRKPATSSIPFIFLTARASKNDLRTGMNLGADDYITKPFTVDELLGAIRSRLERKDLITKKLQEEIALAREELDHAVNFDATTGLPRESAIENWIFENINHEKTESRYCLYLVELDRLNNLIHSLGVHAGEHIMQTFAERLMHASGDKSILFKPDLGDYGIIIDLHESHHDASYFAEAIMDSLKKEIHFQGLDLFIPGNTGLCLHDTHSVSFHDMKNHAYKAVKHARMNGLNQYSLYDPDIDHLSSLHDNLEESIFRAIEKNELSMAYQPQVSCENGQIVGAEALIRWNHSEFGNISPAQFIPIAEETGLILKLGEWIFKQVISDLADLCRQNEHPPAISVNVSTLQLYDESFIKLISQSLQNNLFPPQSLVIEITESMLMKNTKKIIKVLNQIRSYGVRISIDDFGTGFSSLAYIKQFPINTLKIDRSFIKDLTPEVKDPVVTAIINMARNMNLKTIAEGVESEIQKNILKELGCNEFQGFLHSSPVDFTEFAKLYSDQLKLERTR